MFVQCKNGTKIKTAHLFSNCPSAVGLPFLASSLAPLEQILASYPPAPVTSKAQFIIAVLAERCISGAIRRFDSTHKSRSLSTP